MQKIIILIVIISLFSCNAQEKSFEENVKEFHYKENLRFLDKNKSPLTAKAFKIFKELDFFPIDKKYQVIAKLDKTPNSPIFGMQTTTDRKPLYKKYGILTFTIDGIVCKLDIYQNKDIGRSLEYKDNLFLPFTDATSGTLSYGGGRYLDVLTTDEREDGTIIIDFNKTYNPYCAYNGRYSCPITPEKNHLEVAVKAGIMAYKKH